MSLADILAKKKAAAEGSNPTPTVTPAPTKAPDLPKSFEKVEDKMKEEGNTPVGKPMTFAEKMALKKAQTAAPAVAAQTVTEPVTVTSGSSVTQSDPKVLAPNTEPAQSAEQKVSQPVSTLAKGDTGTADTETAQAYADIHARIEALADLSDTPLEGAMSALKKALMANPNAVSLMLDSDYAQMVVALRRLTKEDQLEAAKEKTTGRKRTKKTVDFTNADEVQAVFDEL